MTPTEVILCVVVGFQALTNKTTHDIARLHQERLDRIEYGQEPK